MTTIYAYRDQGPYWIPDRYKHDVFCIAELIKVIRDLMEESVDFIAVYTNKDCKALWVNDIEPEPDGEGGWYMPKNVYVLTRPSAKNKFLFHCCHKDLGLVS